MFTLFQLLNAVTPDGFRNMKSFLYSRKCVISLFITRHIDKHSTSTQQTRWHVIPIYGPFRVNKLLWVLEGPRWIRYIEQPITHTHTLAWHRLEFGSHWMFQGCDTFLSASCGSSKIGSVLVTAKQLTNWINISGLSLHEWDIVATGCASAHLCNWWVYIRRCQVFARYMDFTYPWWLYKWAVAEIVHL